MVFSSLTFLYLFLPLNFLFYFLISNLTYRNWVLILFSLFFYAWGEPLFVFMLVLTVFYNYCCGLWIEKYRGYRQARVFLMMAVALTLGLLGYFKYAVFIVDNLNALLGTGFQAKKAGLPIGISFYTFQVITYVVDVYRGEVPAQKSFAKLLLYISLFPQLVAGPIVRYQDIAAQMDRRETGLSGFYAGIRRFVIGLGKKVILANTAGEISALFLDGPLSQLSVLGAWFGVLLFTLQIYFDFSAYSDMAIGLGKMFGFTYKENFNYPYISLSATEFWRRWHISLGSFFRDYVYIPLGGNRKHPVRNLLIVWFLTGLWHGASWNFILWGLYYGILIILEKNLFLKFLTRIPRFGQHLYLTLVVLVGWVFFYYTDLNQAFTLLGIMFGLQGKSLLDSRFIIEFSNNLYFLGFALAACTPVLHILGGKLAHLVRNNLVYAPAYDELVGSLVNFAILALATVLLVGKTYNPFLYFRF